MKTACLFFFLWSSYHCAAIFCKFCTNFKKVGCKKSNSVCDWHFIFSRRLNIRLRVRRHLPARNLWGQRVQNRNCVTVGWGGGGGLASASQWSVRTLQILKDPRIDPFLPTILCPLDDPVYPWRSLNKAVKDRQLLFPVPCPSSVSSQVKKGLIDDVLIEKWICLFVCFF